MSRDDWLLSPVERGNPHTVLDRRGGRETAWTDGNRVEALIHGETYYRRLYAVLSSLGAGDTVLLTEWRGDADERLDGPGTEVGSVLAELSRRGVRVRGLLWRSHPDQAKFSEQENLHLGEVVNEAGGQVLLDERVRRAGSHHQKMVVIRRGGERDAVAFCGGIDLAHGRRDDERHEGDPQSIDLDPRYGPSPAWHDVQLQVEGPAVGDLEHTFRERWDDPNRLDHRNPLRTRMARRAHEPAKPEPLPPMPPDPPRCGTHTLQVLRTYPARRPSYPFAPDGERSVARAYVKAFRRARRLIYVEDQYLWSRDAGVYLAEALCREPGLRLIAVVPRYPDRDGRLSGPPNRIGQQETVDLLRGAGGDRVAVYDIENSAGWPIYVHAKVCVVDDTWAAIGSDNLNRRSWTHDSELSCAVWDETPDERPPADPGGRGEGARAFARSLRLGLWREHLGRDTDEGLVDPEEGFEAWRESAAALDHWHRGGRQGSRPPGRARVHDPRRVPWWAAWWARPAYSLIIDPDGRPYRMRRAGQL